MAGFLLCDIIVDNCQVKFSRSRAVEKRPLPKFPIILTTLTCFKFRDISSSRVAPLFSKNNYYYFIVLLKVFMINVMTFMLYVTGVDKGRSGMSKI